MQVWKIILNSEIADWFNADRSSLASVFLGWFWVFHNKILCSAHCIFNIHFNHDLGFFISEIQLVSIQKTWKYADFPTFFQHFSTFSTHSFRRAFRSRPSVGWVHEKVRTVTQPSADTALTLVIVWLLHPEQRFRENHSELSRNVSSDLKQQNSWL